MPPRITFRRLLFVMMFSSLLLFAQDARQPVSVPSPQAGAAATPTEAAQPSDEFAQIRDDLNKMDSLNTNMSTEIEFLHDQNLQILLRTNSQLWTMLIRDMRRQLQLQQEHRNTAPVPATPKR